MKRAWVQISVIWLFVAVAAIWVAAVTEHEEALAWYGAILASSIAAVSLIHLVKASASGIVRELIYVAGGSYLILAVSSAYLFLSR